MRVLGIRFTSKFVIDLDTNCWEWVAGKNHRGYGKFWFEGRTVGAHQYAYWAVHGPQPDGIDVGHLCDNPACVNPDHLVLQTRQENIDQRNAKVTHCPRHHEYDDVNTWVDKRGYRYCRACACEKAAERRQQPGYYEQKNFNDRARRARKRAA